MKRINFAFLTIGIALSMSACQPQEVNQAAQQQHFVCKSLIEGFLKTQRLGEYQLNHLQPTLHQTASERNYTYRASGDQNMKLNFPQQKNLAFKCLQKNAEKFEIQLVNPQQIQNQTLLSLSLPPQKTIDTLTAFALKTQ